MTILPGLPGGDRAAMTSSKTRLVRERAAGIKTEEYAGQETRRMMRLDINTSLPSSLFKVHKVSLINSGIVSLHILLKSRQE